MRSSKSQRIPKQQDPKRPSPMKSKKRSLLMALLVASSAVQPGCCSLRVIRSFTGDPRVSGSKASSTLGTINKSNSGGNLVRRALASWYEGWKMRTTHSKDSIAKRIIESPPGCRELCFDGFPHPRKTPSMGRACAWFRFSLVWARTHGLPRQQ